MRRSSRLLLKRSERRLKNPLPVEEEQRDTLTTVEGLIEKGEKQLQITKNLIRQTHLNKKYQRGQRQVIQLPAKSKGITPKIKLGKNQKKDGNNSSKKDAPKVTRSGRSFSPYELPCHRLCGVKTGDKTDLNKLNRDKRFRQIKGEMEEKLFSVKKEEWPTFKKLKKDTELIQRSAIPKVTKVFIKGTSLNKSLSKITEQNVGSGQHQLGENSILETMSRIFVLNEIKNVKNEKAIKIEEKIQEINRVNKEETTFKEQISTNEQPIKIKTESKESDTIYESPPAKALNIEKENKTEPFFEISTAKNSPSFEDMNLNPAPKEEKFVDNNIKAFEELDSNEIELMNSKIPSFVIKEYPIPLIYPEDLSKVDQEISLVDPETPPKIPRHSDEFVQRAEYPKVDRDCMICDTDKYIFRSAFKDISTQIANFDKYRGAECSGGDPNKYDILETPPGETRRFYRKKITDSRLMAWHRYNINACHKYSPPKDEIAPKQVIRIRSSSCHTADLIWRLNQTARIPSVSDVLQDSNSNSQSNRTNGISVPKTKRTK